MTATATVHAQHPTNSQPKGLCVKNKGINCSNIKIQKKGNEAQ
jgi:hypothetical protein